MASRTRFLTVPVFQGLAIIDIAATDLDRDDFTFMIDDNVQLEAKEPAHCCSAALGQVFEHSVTG